MFLVLKTALKSTCAAAALFAALSSTASAVIEEKDVTATSTSTALPRHQNLQIKSEPVADPKDCLEVAMQLHKFNQKVLGFVFQADLRLSSDNTLFGEIYQKSLVIDDRVLAPLCEFRKILHERLYDIEQIAHLWGARKAYISCPENSPLPLCLMKEGYRVVTPSPDLENGVVRICFKKELNAKIASPTSHSIIFRPDGEHNDAEWTEFFMGEMAALPNRFGIFLRENGNTRGGVWGHLWDPDDHDDCGIPHAFIHVLWVDQALKGQGWGKVLMREAEDFATSQGARYLQLDTNTFQAPGFYQKLGFQLTEIRPDDVTAQGNSSSLFMCTKKLFENPLSDRGLKPYFNVLMGSQFFLRPVFPEDYTAYLPGLMDANHVKYYWHGKPFSLEETREYAQEQALDNTATNPKMFNWSIITHQGIAGNVNLEMPNEEWPAKAIGYFICPGFVGRGLATDASRLAMSIVDGPFIATVHPLNLGSSNVLKKLGFKADPNRLNVPRYGSVRDFYLLPDHEPDTSASLGDILKRLVPKTLPKILELKN